MATTAGPLTGRQGEGLGEGFAPGVVTARAVGVGGLRADSHERRPGVRHRRRRDVDQPAHSLVATGGASTDRVPVTFARSNSAHAPRHPDLRREMHDGVLPAHRCSDGARIRDVRQHLGQSGTGGMPLQHRHVVASAPRATARRRAPACCCAPVTRTLTVVAPGDPPARWRPTSRPVRDRPSRRAGCRPATSRPSALRPRRRRPLRVRRGSARSARGRHAVASTRDSLPRRSRPQPGRRRPAGYPAGPTPTAAAARTPSTP